MSDKKIPIMPSSPAFYRGTSRYSFRRDELAEIIGVRMVDVKSDTVPIFKHPCFVLLYADGFIDYSPVSDRSNYDIVDDGAA